MDLVCKVEKSALENSSVSCRRSTFRVSFHGFMRKRPKNLSIPPKLSVANSFNNEGKLDHRFFKLWVSCGFSTKETYEAHDALETNDALMTNDANDALVMQMMHLWQMMQMMHMMHLWQMMHRQTKCCKLSRSTDRNDFESCHICMNESCHVWMSHVTCMNELCHVWMSHVTYVWMSHVTCEWVMLHVNESCHTSMSHVTYQWVLSHINGSHINGSRVRSWQKWRRITLKWQNWRPIALKVPLPLKYHCP